MNSEMFSSLKEKNQKKLLCFMERVKYLISPKALGAWYLALLPPDELPDTSLIPQLLSLESNIWF